MHIKFFHSSQWKIHVSAKDLLCKSQCCHLFWALLLLPGEDKIWTFHVTKIPKLLTIFHGPYHTNMDHIVYGLYYMDHMSHNTWLTSNQFICMHPSESHKQMARPVLNHLCKTGSREISSPWFRTADDPASIRFSFMNFLQWLTCDTISLSLDGWFLTEQKVSWKLLSKYWIFSPSACSKILLKSLNWMPTELSLRA